MLSDAEQRKLTEIERELRSADPEFAERFGHVMRRGPRKWRSMTARAAMALIALTVAGVSAGLWLTGSSRLTDGRPPRR